VRKAGEIFFKKMNTHGGKRENSGRKKKNLDAKISARCTQKQKDDRVKAAREAGETLSDWMIRKTKI
jgi:hypothetical protein